MTSNISYFYIATDSTHNRNQLKFLYKTLPLDKSYLVHPLQQVNEFRHRNITLSKLKIIADVLQVEPKDLLDFELK